MTLSAMAVAACSGGGGGSSGNDTGANLNRAPVALTDVVEANGATLAIPVLANDFDPDGDALGIVLVNAPGHGTTTVSDAGTPVDGRDDYVIYTPASGYTGADSFSYTVTDGADGRATGDVQIMAMPALNAADKAVTTPTGTPIAIDVLDTPRLLLLRRRTHGVVVDHAHVETARAPGHALTDTTQAEDAEGMTIDVMTGHHVDFPLLPATLAQESIRLAKSPGGRDHQTESEIRRRIGQYARRIGHRDATLRRGGNVDVVESDGDVRDRLEIAAAVHELGVNAIGELTDNRLFADNRCPQFLRGQPCR